MERDYLKELVDHKNAEKIYKITSLERRIDHLTTTRNRGIYITGLLLALGAAVPILNQSPTSDYLQVQVGAITSFSALKQYFEMLGPVSTMCCGASFYTAVKYVVSHVKLQRTREDLEDYRDSYKDIEIEELKTYVRK